MIPAHLAADLEQCPTLPSLPAVVIKVIELARHPETTSDTLARVISKDPALSARILSVASSALYGGGEFAGLQQAINRIGMENALSLSLCYGLSTNRKKHVTRELLNYFWKRSLISGLAVQEIQALLHLHFNVDRIYLAAVLQDIGMLALYEAYPERYSKLFAAQRSHRQLASFEVQEFGCSHVQVGMWLGESWGLPEKYTRLIGDSHLVPADLSQGQVNQRVLALSGLLADPWIAENKQMAMTLAYQASQDYLGMTEQQFSHLLLRIEEKLPDIMKLFDVELPDKIDTFYLLQDAKNLLIQRNLRLMQKMAEQQHEIEELRQTTQRLQEQLKRDPLTGIYNRQHTEKELFTLFEQCKLQKGLLAALFIDLDLFKRINDEYGHAIGDAVLKSFASLLENELPQGALAGRYGGEEFVVLLPDTPQEQVIGFARNLQRYLAETPLLSHAREDLYISVSIGIALHAPGDPELRPFADADALINAADQSMYHAKRSGRNRIYLFGPEGIEDISG